MAFCFLVYFVAALLIGSPVHPAAHGPCSTRQGRDGMDEGYFKTNHQLQGM